LSDAASIDALRSRFVILEHDHPFLHWDFLLQQDKVLQAWRLLQPVRCGNWIPAERLPDHRLLYLDYEGPVSNDRGTVRRISSGWFTVERSEADTQQPFALYECDLATQATLRTDDDGHPQWYFG